MLLDALLKSGSQSGSGLENLGMLPDPEAQAKIKKYQDFQDKKLLP